MTQVAHGSVFGETEPHAGGGFVSLVSGMARRHVYILGEVCSYGFKIAHPAGGTVAVTAIFGRGFAECPLALFEQKLACHSAVQMIPG